MKPKEIYLKQYPHGFNHGFVYKDIAPTITISSWEHNNFIIEIEDEMYSSEGSWP